MMSTKQPPTLAIVGGGASGVLVTIQALRQAQTPLHIVVIEQHAELGRGIAYGTHDFVHVLNVRADNMSAYPDAPDHFQHWLKQQHSAFELSDGAFVPRAWYGDYLQSQLSAAIAQRMPDVAYTVLHSQALGVSIAETGVVIHLADGTLCRADHVVLALGNLSSANPFSPANGTHTFTRLLSAHTWFNSAAPITNTDSVILLGTGLTMVDTALTLHARGHLGPITAISRHGLLPQTHRPRQTYPKLRAEQLDTTTVRALLRRMRKEAQEAAMEGIAWQSVLDALRPVTQRIWRELPDVERRRFLRHVRAYWDSHRHRTSPRVMGIIDEIRQKHQLAVLAGRAIACSEDSDGVEVIVRPRSLATTTRIRAAYVINCTGSTCDYATTPEPLIADLREQGLLQPDTLGLGILADGEGRLIEIQGRVSSHFSTLGPPLRGMLWECTSIPDIRVQALSLAQRVVGELERARVT